MKTYYTAQEMYHDVLQQILENGLETSPRGQQTKELLGYGFHLEDAHNNLIAYPDRALNYYFSVAEWLWIMLGQNDVATISRFNSKIADFSDDGVTFSGAYGPLFTEQLSYVLDKLRSDADSRQAVITLWRPRPGYSSDIPCTVVFQYLLREDKLHAVTYMRSNDAWLGLPYDQFNFTRMQAYVAAALDVPAGSYTHLTGSLHLYDWAYEQAGALVEGGYNDSDALSSPPLTYPMPHRVRSVFNHLALHDLEAPLESGDPLLRDIPMPWSMYLRILAYRTLKETRLPREWATLINRYGVETRSRKKT